MRKKIYTRYVEALENFNLNLILPKYSKNNNSAFHLSFININFKNLKKNKDHFMKYLIENKILAQQHYIPIYKFDIYKEKKIYFPGSENFYKNTVSIPIFVDLKVGQQKKVIKVIKNYFKN